jgi:hypothetical protein
MADAQWDDLAALWDDLTATWNDGEECIPTVLWDDDTATWDSLVTDWDGCDLGEEPPVTPPVVVSTPGSRYPDYDQEHRDRLMFEDDELMVLI